MKSMSRAHGDDRKIYQSPGKINIWKGMHGTSGLQRGLSALTRDGSTGSGRQRAVIQLALEERDAQTDRSRHPGQTGYQER